MRSASSACAIRDRAALAALVPDWWELWRAAPNATPFQSPAWLLPWWDCFSPGELFVVAVWQGDRLTALAPCYVETGAGGRRVLPIGISVSDYLDLLVAADVPEALDVVVDYIVTTQPASDEWELTELAPDAAGLRFSCPDEWTEETDITVPCPVLALPSDVAGLRQAIPVRKRRSLAGARNRAARRGPVEIIDGRADTASFLRELIRLHQSRWESAGEAGVFSDPRVRSFHAKALPQLCAAGLARLYLLAIAGRVSAASYGFVFGDRAYSYLTGFDRADVFVSPGSILLGHAIEQAVSEGAREFHFLRGGESYKYDWGAVDRLNTRRVFRRHET
jgi:CelD/BcsL family acetyltransferase involved in cellulose biosynthesis